MSLIDQYRQARELMLVPAKGKSRCIVIEKNEITVWEGVDGIQGISMETAKVIRVFQIDSEES